MGVRLPDSVTRLARPLAWASLVGNIGIVVTGGAVRLTASGLGCPTWPRCTEESFTPHGELDLHSAIEFGNRLITFVLSAIAIATFIVMWRTGRRELRSLALILGLGVPAQAVIGGITVLTDLNPWVVAFHLLCSMAMTGVAALLLWRVHDQPPALGRGRLPVLAWAMFVVTWVVLYLGTVVTGSGPHAGDVDAPRNGLDPLQMSQLHADSVFLLLGLTVALVCVAPAPARRAAVTLLAVGLGQGTIGFVQYFTDLPEILVGFHMLGAALTSAAATWLLLAVRAADEADPAR